MQWSNAMDYFMDMISAKRDNDVCPRDHLIFPPGPKGPLDKYWFRWAFLCVRPLYFLVNNRSLHHCVRNMAITPVETTPLRTIVPTTQSSLPTLFANGKVATTNSFLMIQSSSCPINFTLRFVHSQVHSSSPWRSTNNFIRPEKSPWRRRRHRTMHSMRGPNKNE
mmetsp:Transcript_18807/g.45432  ORF Transcript_18807/g.45432 Transcript_18807/m.45432 type:complete len:165 (+) Transcript_18807:2427-2921(+)